MSLPHCPRCGDRPARMSGDMEDYMECRSCGFGCCLTSTVWAQEVRAELARQALDARAIWKGDSAKERIAYVLREYVELGQHPLRLPGEES
jgi:hypothetical protein